MIIAKWVIVSLSIVILVSFSILETIGIKEKFKDSEIEKQVYIALGVRVLAQYALIMAVLFG